MEVTAKRPYRMGARAEATAATRRSITAAYLELFDERHYDEITLEMVAARAGTTVQTVIRHFGSKDELFTAAAKEVAGVEVPRRVEGPVGDVPAAVRSVVAHYERVGRWALRLLEQEDRFPALKEMTDYGREVHYASVERMFAPFLAAAGDRRRLRGQLIALTDVYVWKLLRLDQGFGRRQTEAAMTEMVERLTSEGGGDA